MTKENITTSIRKAIKELLVLKTASEILEQIEIISSLLIELLKRHQVDYAKSSNSIEKLKLYKKITKDCTLFNKYFDKTFMIILQKEVYDEIFQLTARDDQLTSRDHKITDIVSYRKSLIFNFSKLQLSDSILIGIKINVSDFQNAYFQNVEFNNCDLSRNDYSNAIFDGCKFDNTEFAACNMIDSHFMNCTLNFTEIVNTSCENLTISESKKIRYLKFKFCNIENMAISKSEGDKLIFEDCQSKTSFYIMNSKISLVYFVNSTINYSSFYSSNLQAAMFTNSSVKESTFKTAQMVSTLSTGTDFSRSDFSGTNLESSNFFHSDLSNIKMSNDTNILNWRISDCRITDSDIKMCKHSIVNMNDKLIFPEKLLDDIKRWEKEGKADVINSVKKEYTIYKEYFKNEGMYDESGKSYLIEKELNRMEYKVRIKNRKLEKVKEKAKTHWLKRQIDTLNLYYKYLIESLLYYIGGYGEKPSWVIIWSFIIIILYSILYILLDLYLGAIDGISFYVWHNFFDYLYFSIVTFSTLGYGDIIPKGHGRLLAASEAIIGAILIAFFVVSWVRKLRR